MIFERVGIEPLSSSEPKPNSGTVRVLIADDHPSVLMTTVGVLQPHFEIVGTASNGKMLVNEALRLQPDIIVSDVLMPELSGIDAARQLRERGVTVKFVFLSVYNRGEFVKACLDEGGLAYVTKARMRTDLVFAINEALQGHQFISPSIEHF